MAKQIIYFNATKQIETITIHYNNKLDGAFVDDVALNVKEIAKKMKGVDLKTPREYEQIKVFVYPSKQLFYKFFAGEIEKRFYARKRSLEDLYVVQDSAGNIHIVSPRGMGSEKTEAFKKILVMKILGQYMDEKQKISAERLLKEAMKPKEEEKEEQEEEEPEQEETEEQELDQDEEEIEPEIEEELEDKEIEELDEEELEEIIETELVMEQIDERQETQSTSEEKNESDGAQTKSKITKRNEAQEWLSAGWFAYIKGKLQKEEDIKRFASNISKNGVKKLGQLSQSKWYEEYNYSDEYACAWVECIISTYGMKKFLEYYENPKDITRIFGVPKFIFETQVKSYIKEKYKGDEKVLRMTEDIQMDEIISDDSQEREQDESITEITALFFSSNGGVDIVSDKEIEAPEIQEII